jgi:hypothetical protein
MKETRRCRLGRCKLGSALALVLTVGAAAGAADSRQHGAVSHKVVAIDQQQVHPSALIMRQDDVLEFVNYSAAPMVLAFIQPHDHPARCHVAALGTGDAVAPDAFGWIAGYEPAAVIPPRRFVNICSLAPGHYVFVATGIGMNAAGPMETLGIRGTVTVE